MAAQKEIDPKLICRIKLLTGNLVLVESDDYESELFAPQIVNGRITFANIIPNRRCCRVTKTNEMKFQKSTNYLNKKNKEKQKSAEISSNQFYTMCPPLANSTPAGVRKESILATPELGRRAEPARPRILENSLFSPNIMVSRIYHKTMKGTPKKLGRLVIANTNAVSVNNSANVSILNGSFTLPRSLSISAQYSSRRLANNSLFSSRADSIARWERVLTPKRTYTRKSKFPIMLTRSVTVRSAKKKCKTSTFTPTYLVNPTQGPNVSQEIEIKKRKLIIDGKISISPKTFKKHQKDWLEAHTKMLTTLQTNTLSFSKPSPYLESTSMSAFDLLTNSNRSSNMSKNLNNQFRKNCVNKASSTYYKYKVLSIVPPLEHDEQILELSHQSANEIRILV